MSALTPSNRADAYKLILLLALLTGVIVLFNALYIVPPRGNCFDFYPHWEGGRALWQGQSPYSPEVTAAIQQGMFGGTLPPDADQQRVVYPAYVGVILAPLLAIPAPTAIAIWLAIQLMAVLTTPILWLQIINWKPPPWLLGLLIVGLVLIFRYPVNLYLLGQFTGTILFGFSLSVYLLIRRRDIAAGIVLALTAIPPTIAAPMALILLVGHGLNGRWRALAAFSITMVILIGITMVQIGWWLPDFVAHLGTYGSYAAPVWGPGLIESALLRWLLIGGVGLILLLVFLRFRQAHQIEDFAIGTMLLCLLVLSQTGNYYLVLLIPPLLVSFRRGGVIRRLGVALAILSPWLFRLLPEPSPEALLLPLYVLVLWSVGLLREDWQSLFSASSRWRGVGS